MKKKLLFVLCYLNIWSANAADTLFVLQDSMMHKKEIYELSSIAKWKFHEGKDKKWMLKDFDDSNWQETSLIAFEKMQKNDHDYCLRFHFKVDSSFKEPLFIRFYLPMPSIVFVNGKQLYNFNQASNLQDYTIDITRDNPVPIDKQKENVVVIFSDYSTRNFIKDKTLINTGVEIGSTIITYSEVSFHKKFFQTFNLVLGAVLMGLGLLAFFAFFLKFYDKKDKTLFWITTIISLMFLSNFIDPFLRDIIDISITITIGSILTSLWVSLISIVISNVIMNKTEKTAKILFLINISFDLLLHSFLRIQFFKQYGIFVSLFFAFLTLIYIVFLLKKKLWRLNKPQWTVVAGLFVSLLAGIITVVYGEYFSTIQHYLFYNFLVFITYISFPVSLLIYASLKLRQNLVIIQQKATQITDLSIEKEKILKEQNETLEKQVEERTAQLRASQNQLIQKEKLASLGELTAGIAHEIQNPLNFVNNFSELSSELIDEMNEEIERGDIEEVKSISGDLKQNLEKINHHGKRASSIVKGMLEHSRTGTGEQELTDLNKLTDEYLRLSYHGMKAKDKNFEADYELIADLNLPKVKVVPQEIGRVVLNLLNNAFYAVNSPNVTNPKVIVSTSHSDKEVVIKVHDNGTGIPDSIKAKIFQPFFTTKPTGEGTGLGLSLSYDIITKGNSGKMEVESVEGKGSEFIIKLPINIL